MKKLLTLLLVLTSVVVTVQAQRGRGGRNLPTHEKEDFYKTEEARRIGDQVLLYQRVTGGWPKNINMSRPLTDEERVQVLRDKERRDDSTTDNGATNMQMLYLAKLYQATQVERYKEGVLKAVEYLLSGQYENGGWPQFWPEMHGYQMHITYNDDAMVNTMNLLRAVAQQKDPYQGLADEALHQRCMKAFDKGVECILKTQMHNKEGRLTVWCQQHYRDTYEPAPARAYELPSSYAYVIAHEVGHHVEYLTGTLQKVHAQMAKLSQAEANKLSVRLELLADFYAGVWAHHDNKRFGSLEDGDIEEAINCAQKIGDDYLQTKARGYAVPESFNHGTSKQRMKWFKLGLETGDISRGNTFQCSDAEL